MKTKFLTLALFGILNLGFLSCANEDIAPSNESQLLESNQNSVKGDNGISERDR